MNQDKVIALTIYFDDNGEPEHVSNQQFQFLVDRYKNPNMKTATDKYLDPNKMIKVTLIILAICTFPFSLPFIIWYKVAQKKKKETK